MARVPAKAGTHLPPVRVGTGRRWAPAFAGAHGIFIAMMTLSIYPCKNLARLTFAASLG
ncbi:hypothetical protein FHR22_003657 [Sphingopyxis panaciterrae]|nr:hypothetical protein [Sphingopyxis panaciterrae]